MRNISCKSINKKSRPSLPTIPDNPKVVTMVVKAALGDAIPRASTVPSPAVYFSDVFRVFLNGSTGSGGGRPTAVGLGAAATASSCGGGAGGKISP